MIKCALFQLMIIYTCGNVFPLPSVFKDVAEFNWDTQLQGNVFVLFVFFVSLTEFVLCYMVDIIRTERPSIIGKLNYSNMSLFLHFM